MAGSVRSIGGMGGGSFLTVLSATTLVGAQALATAVAAGWAVAGLFHLGDAGEYALMGLFGLVAAYASLAYFRRARVAEANASH